MIAYFPKIYEDELLYSVFARFHIHTGYLFFENTKNKLFKNKETTPIVEFINELNPEIVDFLTKDMTMEEVILKHTMFPYYARFHGEKKRREELNSLIKMESNFCKTIPKKYRNRYLRYCPVCAKEDRESKGEAIWYRKHQVVGVFVCPIHGCKLIESNVPISREVRHPYITAEQEIREDIEIREGSQLEKNFSVYIAKLLSPDMENNSNAGKFLKKKANVPIANDLYKELCEFYSDLGDLSDYINIDSTKKVLNGNNDNALRVSLIAFYLGVPVEELIGSYKGICELERKKRVLKKIPKAKNYWKNQDDMYFSRIESVIAELRGNDEVKPERVCVSSVERALGIPKGIIRSMDKCMEYINRENEDMETYHAKLAIWCIKKLLREGKVISWAQICVHAHIMYRYKEKCLRRAKEIAEGDILEIINALF